MGRWQTDVAIGVVLVICGVAALGSATWLAALLFTLSVATVAVPAWLRHRLAAKEAQALTVATRR
jgi:hypothetical protein